MFTTNTIQAPAAIQYQTSGTAGAQQRAGGAIIKALPKMDAQKAGGQQQQQSQQEFPTFCYTNVSGLLRLSYLLGTKINLVLLHCRAPAR